MQKHFVTLFTVYYKEVIEMKYKTITILCLLAGVLCAANLAHAYTIEQTQANEIPEWPAIENPFGQSFTTTAAGGLTSISVKRGDAQNLILLAN